MGHPLARSRPRAAAALLCALLLAAPGWLGAPQPARAAENPWTRAGRAEVARLRPRIAGQAPAKNAVLFIGDGMSLATVDAARILQGQLAGHPGEENALSFEAFPHLALMKVYNTDQQVPDSAGTMTAMMSGVKTRAGLIGLDQSAQLGSLAGVAQASVPTLLELAEARGLATGVVTTTRVTHATPAACYGHSPDRDWEADSDLPPEALRADFPDLARQLVETKAGDGIDVVLGGGRAWFLGANEDDPVLPDARGRRYDERDLPDEWKHAGEARSVVFSAKALGALEPGAVHQVLGLFAPDHLAYEVDRAKAPGDQPSLADMTAAAIRLLSRHEQGFVLMVEGGRIDHAHHANDAYRALTETIELSRAVEAALAATDPAETLVVVTADHGHPFTFSGYASRGNPILGLVDTHDAAGKSTGPARDGTGRAYTTLGYRTGPGWLGASDAQPAGPKHFPHEPRRFEAESPPRPPLDAVDTRAPDYLQESHVPLRSGAHSGEDVPLYAEGPRAALLDGVHEQNYLFHALVEALGWNDAPPEPR